MFPRRFVSYPFPVLLTPSPLPDVSSLTHLPDWTVFLSCTFTALRLFVLVFPLTGIYTGLEMGRLLRFHRFLPHSAAAVRPECTDSVPFSPFFSYAHGRYAITGRFPCRARPVTLASCDPSYSRVTCHRSAYSYVPVSFSRDSYCTCMCHGDPPRLSLCHAYVFVLTILTHPRL